GSPPKRRSVLTVFDWSAEILQQWNEEVRPLFPTAGSEGHRAPEPAVGNSGRTSSFHFTTYRDALGLDDGLDFHSFRRSYVTHLIEKGMDARFVQEQVGHEHASTTAIYTCVSSDFRTRTLRRALDATMQAALRPARRA
ncbi:tyrosine-type recombinase/integrase, partial [Streptomyces sp. C1-2]|uniref:tyrosine-type recombinase/integrase n=1 Tax=Streptomyces sp. C1-2 TaxID=2720022 RepID=UPI00143255D4